MSSHLLIKCTLCTLKFQVIKIVRLRLVGVCYGSPPLYTPTLAYPQGAAEGGCPQVECLLLLCVHLLVLHIHMLLIC